MLGMIQGMIFFFLSQNEQDLHFLVFIAMSTILSFTRSMHETMPFRDAYPRRCHEPSKEATISVGSFALLSSFVKTDAAWPCFH